MHLHILYDPKDPEHVSREQQHSMIDFDGTKRISSALRYMVQKVRRQPLGRVKTGVSQVMIGRPHLGREDHAQVTEEKL